MAAATLSSHEAVAVIVASLLLVAVFASKASAKLGIPALALFIGIGMAIGVDGPGGIPFDDYNLVKVVGSIALAFILFAGGLETEWKAVRPVLKRGLVLATLGVGLTAGAVGLFGHYVLGFALVPALLLGAIVSSTDAAAVFGVLRARNIRLRRKLAPLLELESGTNDPMAIFLTFGLTRVAIDPSFNPMSLIPQFFWEMAVGAIMGAALGWLTVRVINRVRLEYDGLYPIITIASALLSYGATALIGGNGFLAVYVCAVWMGRQAYLHRLTLEQFHNALAWLMQIAMFLLLGLLANPVRIMQFALPALALSAFLMFVARPLAVFISMSLFRSMKTNEKLFVSWVGLRGALPIVIATIPISAGAPFAARIFDYVFFIVLTSVLIQGWSLPWVAAKLKVMIPEGDVEPLLKAPGEKDLLEVTVQATASAAGKAVLDLGLPRTALIVLLRRRGESFMPQGSTRILPGDELVIATRKRDWYELVRLFEG
ncbi:MAG: potassium/proton antiporter [Armatimonadota bacterium]|nr:potassium/proton antiporter [Armatimonadota bacterium]